MSSVDLGDSADKAGFPNGHALLIAVAAYSKVSPLPAAVINDAREIASVLVSTSNCGYNSANVNTLLDSEATLDSIRRELQSLASRAKPDDTVVIFFSGHGVRLDTSSDGESALVPIDCDPSNISATTLSEREFSTALTQIKAQRLVVFIDACHSGGAGTFKATGPIPDLGFNEKSLGRLAQGTGRVLIASSRASETSLILDGASNSLFTEHLLGALRGKARTHRDGLIRVFELFNHVAEKVRNAAPGRQHPIFKASDLEDNFPVALDCGGIKGPLIDYGDNRTNDADKKLEDILPDLYPIGPQDQEIWSRAGGDISQLRLMGTGRANWFAALRALKQGGGGRNITRRTLIEAVLEDFPHHPTLTNLSHNS